MEQLVRVKKTFDDGTALVIHVRESACSGSTPNSRNANPAIGKNPEAEKTAFRPTREARSGYPNSPHSCAIPAAVR